MLDPWCSLLPAEKGLCLSWQRRDEAESSETGDFDGQISQLLSHTDVTLDMCASLAKKFEMDIFCGWFMHEGNEGIVISPQTLHMLGERHIGLSADIYAPLIDE